MSREVPSWAVVGAEMVRCYSGFDRTRYVNRAKITKVLGNGNIRIGDGPDQYRPDHSGVYGGSPHAHKAGAGYSSEYWQLVTPALEAEIAEDARYDAAVTVLKKEAERIENLWRRGPRDLVIDAALKLQPAGTDK